VLAKIEGRDTGLYNFAVGVQLWESCPGVMGPGAITEPGFNIDFTKEQEEVLLHAVRRILL
jgi:hypothetical protein